MSEIVTIRVSKELKELMNKYDINWSEELREYIEAKMKSFRLHGLLKGIVKDAQKIKVKGDSTKLIREDRDSR
ncbi:MAG: hypothetical protein KGI00_01695 [Candidatus Micrarchaeota archaeon]|nr:hypothetical protein [Candidatus Micrarchaeota archaeon]MDE1824172.1 hypothetical protein [Candidatus Micrarchaeota archaeon]MDE1849421.1 hypothetical protein [Candidatus Micrarchaeota archaeon]